MTSEQADEVQEPEGNGGVSVSVVISTRNRAGWLPDCLGSLAAQDHAPAFEVIVIDNASDDDTPDVLSRWCSQDPRFRTAREERIGLSAGKNRGIQLARGRVLLFTDDDVMVDPGWIASYADLFSRVGDEAVIAGGRIAPIPHDLGPWPPWFDDGSTIDLALLDHLHERALERGEYVWGANMAVPMPIFERFGTWNEDVGNRDDQRETYEDAEFQDRMRTHGVDVWFCPAAAIRHRVNRGTITARRLVTNAFNRGRNEFWATHLPGWGDEPRSWPRRSALTGTMDLGSHLARWAWWTLIFGASPRAEIFARCRREAYRSGWTLETLRGGRGRSFHVIGRVALFARDAMCRLTSGRAWIPSSGTAEPQSTS